MQELARGYSYVLYTAAAGATYTIPFPYLHAEHLRVYAGDVGDAVEQPFKLVGPTEIQLTSKVPEGILVTVRRFTPRDDILVHIQDGAQLPAKDLNLNTTQLLYVMQEQIDYGTGGKGLPGGGTGWPDPGGGTPNLTIQQIIDALMQSPVFALLTSRLEDIDSTAETMLEELLRSEQVFDHRRAIDQRVAFVETEITSLSDDTQSIAKMVTELYAQHDDSAAQIISVQEALASETQARATAITQVNAAIGENKSAITSMQQSIVDEAGARATAITKVQSDYKTADTALTTAIYQTVANTYATPDKAQSIATNTVAAFKNGNFAQLEQRFEAIVTGGPDPIAGEWQANYTVRINAGAINGVPVIAGIGLGVDSKTGSNFIVMADRFGIVSPTYTTTGGVQQMKFPFVVGTVGGVSTVGITGQLLVDGSITADKLKVNSLSALTANMGEVNGGTFRTFQLDGNGGIINPLEFRAELTNNPGDGYPVWVGSGAKNWNNAVFAVDRAGNAKFAGKVSAQNVTDQLQRQVVFDWSGSVAASSPQVLVNFTLPAPIQLGETHTPLLTLETEHISDGSGGKEMTTGTIVVEVLSGSTWVVLRTCNISLYKFSRSHSALIISDTPTSGDRQYRVRVTGGETPIRFENIHGFAFGLR